MRHLKSKIIIWLLQLVFEKVGKYECVAYNNWVGSLNKKGFPKNPDGTMMDCWQLFNYYQQHKEIRKIYLQHSIGGFKNKKHGTSTTA